MVHVVSGLQRSYLKLYSDCRPFTVGPLALIKGFQRFPPLCNMHVYNCKINTCSLAKLNKVLIKK